MGNVPRFAGKCNVQLSMNNDQLSMAFTPTIFSLTTDLHELAHISRAFLLRNHIFLCAVTHAFRP